MSGDCEPESTESKSEGKVIIKPRKLRLERF